MDENALKDGLAQLAAQNPPLTPDDRQVVEQLTRAEQDDVFSHASENYNLAEKFEAGLLNEIGTEVKKGYQDDEQSRSEWMDMHSFWLSLYMQQDYAENSDAERAWGATESIPILTEACDQFQTRTYKSFFPNDTFISAIPMRRTPNDIAMLDERAKRIGNHMSYQLGYEDRNYKRDKDALFLGVALHGSFFTKSYFSDSKRRFQVDNVRPTDLVVNYHIGAVRIEDLHRKSHIIYTTVGKTEELVRKGFFIQPAQPSQAASDNPYNWKVNESQGLTAGNQSLRRDKLAVLIEQHTYLDIDDSGQFLPYIVTICAASGKVLRCVIGWEATPEGRPLKDYEQVQYFTHYKFKENPDGFYGLGLGHSIGDLNSAANIMLRQSMDAATLANDGNMSGFISSRLGVEGDEIRCTMGKFTKIEDTLGDIKNGIVPMQFAGPNAALITLMQAIDLRAQRLGSTTEVTTGTRDKVDQPTTYLAQVEQAMESFSAVQMRLANSFSEELQKIYRINQRYMPLVSYYTVNNTPETITRSDYADDMLIQPIFDPRFATQSQKVARAQAELQAVMQNPNSQTRPQVFDAAYRRYFEALEVDNIDELIPPAVEPANVDNQLWENSQIMMPPSGRQPFDAFPEHDHLEHLAQIERFAAEKGATLQPDQIQLLLEHKQKHEAYLYAQQNGLEAGLVNTTPLATRQNNPMDFSAATQGVPDISAILAPEMLGSIVPERGAAAGA